MASVSNQQWGSRFGFIMAAVGSSVGLGNFWRFPYTAGENGGAAFILIYLGCVVLFGLPVLMAEYSLGRKSQRSAISGISFLAKEEGKSPAWVALGWVGSLAAFIILTFYMVISAWIVIYVFKAFGGLYSGWSEIAAQQAADASNPELRNEVLGQLSGEAFGKTLGNTGGLLAALAGFIAVNVLIVSRGISGGIERAATILMPAFFVLLIGIVAFGLIVGDAGKAAAFLLTPDFSAVKFSTFLAAVGQAFFSIGVGSCLMITYGSYLTRETSIPRSSVIVAGADSFVAIIAGFAIFPLLFQFGGSPGEGAGLFFVTLPTAFAQMPGGVFIGGLFFTLALFAALTSSISLMEVGVAWLGEKIGRPIAAVIVGVLLFGIGSIYVLDSNHIDIADFISGYIMLPLGGILVAFFAGWTLSRSTLISELGDGLVFNLWRNTCRFVVPPAVAFILVFGAMQKAGQLCYVDLPEPFKGLLLDADEIESCSAN